MQDPELKVSNKFAIKRPSIKPLNDICVNLSDSPTHKVSFINSPVASQQCKKRILVPKSLAASPSTPRNSPPIPGTPKSSSSKIKSPSEYVFSTHSHSSKFASTPKRIIQTQRVIQSSTPKAKPTEDSIVTSVPLRRNGSRQKNHLFSTFQALSIARALREPTTEEILGKLVNLPRKRGYEKKKTVIFDLDETLVHCVGNTEAGQVDINIELPDGPLTKVSINIRPYVQELLATISKDFEVIVFTASHKCYADPVIDYLDPQKQWIHHRLYRHNCVQIDGFYIKDLRIILDRNIKDLIIVDNAAYSFSFHLLNGIPIISWYNDSQDRELYKLVEYLRILSKVDDIRAINKLTFHLDSFYEDYIRELISKSDKENISNS